MRLKNRQERRRISLAARRLLDEQSLEPPMSRRAELSTGEALVGLLEAYGVDVVFGIPGVHNVEMYRALPASKITHILTRHEQGAGFMADGYARATGKPGVCFTITGPGLLNILTPMGQAWSDSSPIYVISSALDISDNAQGRGRLHEMQNQRQAAASIATRSVTAFTPKDVQDAMATAFAAFGSQRPRPAYLELPLDLLKQPCGEGWVARPLPARSTPNAPDIAKAANLLASARKPLLILGGGALDATEPALEIAEALGAIVLTTIAGKGAIPARHPLCLGARMAQPPVKKLMIDADVILAVGTEISETDLWEASIDLPGKIIRIDLDPENLARPHRSNVPILADARVALTAIAEALPKMESSKRRQHSETFIADYLRSEPEGDDELRVLLRKVLGAIRASLPQETIIASDMTQIAYAANEIFDINMPRSWIHPVGFGTLGFALPAAIGAKAALPARPVAALLGDYGFQYTLNELGTAVELGQQLLILLWNNDALGQIRDDMVNKGIQPNAVTLRNPDFQALARAYGATAEMPRSIDDLQAAIAKALKARGPTLIEMRPSIAK
jgi:5-guanidino-2-oxopentanoate decarboxylase